MQTASPQESSEADTNRSSGKGRGNKGSPVRIQINNEAEYLPFPNFPAQNKRRSQQRLNTYGSSSSQADALYGNKRLLFLNERFPRNDDGGDSLEEDDLSEAFDEEDVNYIDYSESKKPNI